VTVEMMEEMSVDDWDEKSGKNNYQDEVDGIRREVYSKGKEMHNEMSDLRFLKGKMTVIERG